MKYVYISLLSFVLTACGTSSQEQAIREIKAIESNSVLQGSDSLVNTWLRFADGYPQHALAPVFLFKAAQSSIRSGKTAKAARLYERIGIEYQADTLAPEALIRGGIAYASIPDPANAKRLYDLFVQKFPQHPRVEEVRMWSETSGMSEEELLRRFEARLKDSAAIE